MGFIYLMYFYVMYIHFSKLLLRKEGKKEGKKEGRKE